VPFASPSIITNVNIYSYNKMSSPLVESGGKPPANLLYSPGAADESLIESPRSPGLYRARTNYRVISAQCWEKLTLLSQGWRKARGHCDYNSIVELTSVAAVSLPTLLPHPRTGKNSVFRRRQIGIRVNQTCPHESPKRSM
jgi:hypothetical protein